MNGFTYHDGKLEDVYSIKDELGRGQFAVVKRCIHQADETEVAAKFIKVKRTRTSKNGLNRELIEREASILQSINHEKIIKLYDVFDLGIEIVLVLELLSGGELFDKICELEYLTEVDACCYLKQVLLAIDHLHDSSIVHLDIKPENIVLKSNDSTDIKLVDFGLAQKLRPGEELKEMMGTPEFVAPEVINYEKIGLYTDMWAIGVLAYILLSGCSPFLGDDNQETYENIIKVDYHFDEEYFDKISIDAKQFVSELLVKAPHKRNTAKDCLDHPWIMTMSQPRSRFDSSIIVTTRFKAFVARRRWQQSFQKLNAITRFSKLMKKGGSLPTFNEEDVPPGVSPCSSPPSQNTIDDTESKSDDEKNDKLNDDDVDKNVVNCDTTDGKSSDITENRLANQERMEIDTDNDINISTNISLTENKHTVINSNNHTIDDVPEIKITSNNIDSHVNGHNRSDRVSDEPQLIVSHVHPNRKYSREAPVHYTQMMRDAILLEKEKELALRKTEQQVHEDSEEDDTIDEKKKLIDDEVKTDLKKEEQKEVEEDKLSKKHTSEGDCAEGIKTNDVVIETVSTSGDCDFGEVKAFDIRESKVCRISSRKKAVFVDHKSMLNDESIRKPVRSASLDEQRRKFILGERPRPHSVDSAVLLDEKNKKEVEKLPSVSEDESKGDVFEEVDGAEKVNNEVEPTQTLSFEMTENPTLSGTGVLPLDVNKNSSTEETLDMNENKENNNCVKDTMKSKHPQIETDDVKENSKNVKKKKSCTCRKRCSLM